MSYLCCICKISSMIVDYELLLVHSCIQIIFKCPNNVSKFTSKDYLRLTP